MGLGDHENYLFFALFRTLSSKLRAGYIYSYISTISNNSTQSDKKWQRRYLVMKYDRNIPIPSQKIGGIYLL